MRSGLVMMARAMVTRRRIPPESSGGNLAMVFASSTNCMDSITRLYGPLSSWNVFFVEAIGHVVLDGEGIEEGGLPGRPCPHVREA